jgi:diguanylate cyclase (GGDEF)-like protein
MMVPVETGLSGAPQAAHKVSAFPHGGLTGPSVNSKRWIPAVEAERDALAARLRAAERVIADQQARLTRLTALAETDELTGLNNRRGFFANLKRQLARARRNPAASGVLILADVDEFKQINDRMGHLAGDTYLRRVAALLAGCMRESDSVARLGGDEFAILLTDLDETSGRRRAAEIVERANEARSGRGATRVSVRLSFGVGPYRAGDKVAEIIDRADRALYENKAFRRGTLQRRGNAIEGTRRYG